MNFDSSSYDLNRLLKEDSLIEAIIAVKKLKGDYIMKGDYYQALKFDSLHDELVVRYNAGQGNVVDWDNDDDLSVIRKMLAQQKLKSTIVTVLISLFSLLVIIYLQFRSSKKRRKAYEMLVKKRNQISSQNLELLLLNDQLKDKKQDLERQKIELEELNELKAKLLSIISHDLKNPLQALTTIFSMLKSQTIPEEEIPAFFEAAEIETYNTVGLMDNLLFWAKNQINGLHVSPINIKVGEIVSDNLELIQPHASRKNIKLACVIEDNLIVFADLNMLNLVIRNILTNAVKFTNEDGNVAVKGNLLGNQVEITISDDGVGIEKENMTKIFSSGSFSTTGTKKEMGTGLGLSLCKEFIEKNNGQISVQSTPGEGTTFSIVLPGANLVNY